MWNWKEERDGWYCVVRQEFNQEPVSLQVRMIIRRHVNPCMDWLPTPPVIVVLSMLQWSVKMVGRHFLVVSLDLDHQYTVVHLA